MTERSKLGILGGLSLKAKLLCSISLLILAATLSVSLSALRIFKGHTVEKAKERLVWVAREGIHHLDRTIAEQISTVRMWAGMQAFVAALQYDSYEEADALCAALAAKNRQVLAIDLLDTSLKVRSSNHSERAGRPSGLDRNFLDGNAGPFGRVAYDERLKQYVYTISAPVRAGFGLGFLVVHYRWTELTRGLWNRYSVDASRSDTGYLLLDGQGTLLAASAKALKSGEFRRNFAQSGLPSASVRLRSGGLLEADPEGTKVVSGFAVSEGSGGWKGTGWRLVVSERLSSVLSVSRRIQARVVLVSIVMVSIAIGLTWLVISSSMIAPIRRLVAALERVAEGDLTWSPKSYADDELGELARAMGKTVGNLRSLLSGITDSSVQVTRGSALVGSISAQVTSGSGSQLTAVDQTLHTMRAIVDSVGEVAESSEELAASVEEASGQMAHIGSAVQQMTAGSVQLKGAAETSSRSIEELARSVREVDAMADRQTTGVKEVRAAVAQIAAGVERIASSASEAQEIAERNVREGNEGMDAVRRTALAMKKMNGVIQSSNNAIGKLHERSADIRGMFKIMEDIAAQTSLLALNASIIAAQAGAQGTAFGIVANNVRDLAAKSKSATGEIQSVIEAITEEMVAAATLAQATLREASESSALSEKAGTAIASMVGGIRQSADLLGKVSGICGSQRDFAASVVGSVATLERTTDQLKEATREQSEASTRISDAAAITMQMAVQVSGATDEQALGISEMVETMAQMDRTTQGVAQMTVEQRQSSEAVALQLAGVRDVSSHNLQVAELLADASRDLDRAGKDMRLLIERFVL
ncbi:MAG: methyl-accepting chemotaxis protein [Deltaproteobacteria bacterium]|nr:methyl-accepting chemotaxis protein [Deltaproteobacteria bacterium]